MKNTIAAAFAALFLVACSGTPTDEPVEIVPYVITTDIDSCNREPDQPWCQAECEHHEMEWCE